MKITKIDGLSSRAGVLEKLDGCKGWFYAVSDCLNLYEVREIKALGHKLPGNELSFFYYPEKEVFTPFKQAEGVYYEGFAIKYLNEKICFIQADFNKEVLTIYAYSLQSKRLSVIETFDLKSLSLYNIRLYEEPLMLCAQNNQTGCIEFYYPQKFSIKENGDESFCFRQGGSFTLANGKKTVTLKTVMHLKTTSIMNWLLSKIKIVKFWINTAA